MVVLAIRKDTRIWLTRGRQSAGAHYSQCICPAAAVHKPAQPTATLPHKHSACSWHQIPCLTSDPARPVDANSNSTDPCRRWLATTAWPAAEAPMLNLHIFAKGAVPQGHGCGLASIRSISGNGTGCSERLLAQQVTSRTRPIAPSSGAASSLAAWKMWAQK